MTDLASAEGRRPPEPDSAAGGVLVAEPDLDGREPDAGAPHGEGGGHGLPPGPRRVSARIVRQVLAVVVLVGLVYATGTFLQVWRASSRDDVQQADAIVVLGAAQYDGRPSPVLEARLQHGLDLYRQGVAPRIVVTGGRQVGDRFAEATSGYLWLLERGVPDEAILKEVDGRSTYESLAATARFLTDDGLDEVVIVSDDYHALRVAGTAHEVGLVAHVSVVPTDGVPVAALARETAAVSAGRIVSYRRLAELAG